MRTTALSAGGASAADAVAGGSFADEMKRTLARVSNVQKAAASQADASHLAAALDAKVKQMLTLDAVFARNAKKLKITVVEIASKS